MYRAVAAGREPERWVPLSTEARPFRLVATADAWILYCALLLVVHKGNFNFTNHHTV